MYTVVIKVLMKAIELRNSDILENLILDIKNHKVIISNKLLKEVLIQEQIHNLNVVKTDEQELQKQKLEPV